MGGAVKISGTPTPGLVYTGIRGEVAYPGKAQANADVSSVVVASAYKFCRSSDPCFKNLNGSPSLDLKQLQFGWASLVAEPPLCRCEPSLGRGSKCRRH